MKSKTIGLITVLSSILLASPVLSKNLISDSVPFITKVNDERNLISTKNNELKLNEQALNDILQTSHNHIIEYINGNILYIGSEAGEPDLTNLVIPSINSNLKFTVSFKTDENEFISISKLKFSSLTFSHLPNSEPKVTSVLFKTTSQKYNEIEIFYDEPVTVLIKNKHKNIAIEKTLEKTLLKKYKLKREIPRNKNDFIKSDEILKSPLNTLSSSTSWPTPKYPYDFSTPKEHSYGVSILFLIHPRLLTRYSLDKLRSRYFIKFLDRANKILENEDIIDGISGRHFRFYTAYQANYNGTKSIYSYTTPPAELCPYNYCTNDFSKMLGLMNNSSKLRELKKAWKADVVIFVHDSLDPVNQVEGLANVPISPYDTSFNNYANAVTSFYQLYDTDAITHESMHSLGAGHSRFNKVPGINKAKSYLNHFVEEHQPYGYMSFMTYRDICEQQTKDSNCEHFDRLSSPKTYVKSYGKTVRLGTPYDDNKSKVIEMIRAVSNYSK